jgi:hypothetical protein
MKIKYLIILICSLFILTACSDVKDQAENIINSENEYVLKVKGGHPHSYPDKTFGEYFDKFFGSPTWKYFKGTKEGLDEDKDGKPDESEENVDVVEFTGYCTYKDVRVKALLQFTINKDNETFDASYLSFNEVPQDSFTLSILLSTIFDDENESSQKS